MNRNLFGKSPKYSDLKSHELEMQGKKKDLQRSRRMSRSAAYSAIQEMPWSAARKSQIHSLVKNHGMSQPMRRKLKVVYGVR